MAKHAFVQNQSLYTGRVQFYLLFHFSALPIRMKQIDEVLKCDFYIFTFTRWIIRKINIIIYTSHTAQFIISTLI